MEILQTKPNIQFTISSAELAKELRRYIMEDIPCMAISTTDVIVNHSLYDSCDFSRMIFHTPLYCNPDDFNLVNDGHLNTKNEPCREGCDKCQVVFDIDVTCPQGKLRDITNLDLQKRGKAPTVEVIKHEIDGKISPLTLGKLARVGQVKIVCTAHLNYPTKDCRWSNLAGVVICIPTKSGVRFTLNTNGKVPIEWLLNRIESKYNQLTKEANNEQAQIEDPSYSE